MYYITKRTSETGKKFQRISEKRQMVLDAQKDFADKYGFKQWRKGHWKVFGGISSCVGFKETPDKKIWGKGQESGEYFPKQNSKAGKEVYKEIENLPYVSKKELNMCIGFDEGFSKTIGFAGNNEEYFGFVTDENWGVEPPKDCEEVTTTKYRELFY